MEEQLNEKSQDEKKYHPHNHVHNHSGEAVYGLGMIGAAIFFIGNAGSFWPGVLGFLKAIVWPVFLVYEALKFLQK